MRVKEEKIIDEFIKRAIAYRIPQLFPDQPRTAQKTIGRLLLKDGMQVQGRGWAAVQTELKPLGLGSERDMQQLRACEQDIMNATMGLGIDMEEPGSETRVLWSSNSSPRPERKARAR